LANQFKRTIRKESDVTV